MAALSVAPSLLPAARIEVTENLLGENPISNRSGSKINEFITAIPQI